MQCIFALKQNTAELILWVFILAAIVQIFFWAIFFARLAFYRAKQELVQKAEIPVSIIICARNEADNLAKNLTHIITQDYPNFEIIVADDDSDDKTFEIMQSLCEQYQNLHYLKVGPKNKPGKRAALTAAIGVAKYDWLLMTDADCQPKGASWISSMTAQIQDPSTEIVLGYGPYRRGKSLLNSWIRFETFLSAAQYFSATLWGISYMGVGRNLLIKKSLWLENLAALENNSDLMSGDDDLMVNAAANKKNTAICLQKESFVYSEPKGSLKALITQKSRHYSTGTRYKTIHKVFLGAFSLSQFLFWMTLLPALIYNFEVALIFFILRLIIFLSISFKIIRNFDEQKLFIKLILLDFLLPFYYLFFAPTLILKNRQKWK
jgi:glycosyltransferase involved in cell wall biosynthesis